MSAALISAGASLLGGFFNRSATRKANEKNRPENQVREWEQAGINPIFGLSSGSYVPHQPSMIGDSFAAAGAQYARSLDLQHEKELRETQIELENERLRLEIDKMSRPSEPGHLQKALKSNERRNIQAVSGIPAGRGSNVGADVDAGRATVTHVGIVGDGTFVNPRIRDAEMSEARYGDLAQEFVGAVNLIGDNYYNKQLQRVVAAFGQPVAEQVNAQYALGDSRSLSKIIDDVTAGKPRKVRPKLRPKPKVPGYDPNLNPPLRGYYGKPGSRTGF